MAICNYRYVDEVGNPVFNPPLSPIATEVLTPNSAFEKLSLPNYWYYVPAYNKLYSRYLFDNLRFPEGRIHEDQFLIHHLLGRCKRITVTDATSYYYVQRKGSILHQKFSPKQLDSIYAMLNRHDYFLDFKKYSFAHHALRRGYGYIYHYLTLSDALEYPSEIREHFLLVEKLLIRHLDLRAIKLLIRYLYYCRNVAQQKQRGDT